METFLALVDASRELKGATDKATTVEELDEAARRFAVVPRAEVVSVPKGRHLWIGQAETVLDEIVERVAPGTGPLPTTWDGEMAVGDASAYKDRTVAAFNDPD